MPMYTWECSKCRKSVDILRHWDLHRDPPNEEEGGRECEKDGGHEFEKKIHAPLIARGAGWAGKGNW